MRAIIINAQHRTITETEIDGSLKSLQQIVGGMIEAGNVAVGTGAILTVRVPVAGRMLDDAPPADGNGKEPATAGASARASASEVALATAFNNIVLPVFGWATINPR